MRQTEQVGTHPKGTRCVTGALDGAPGAARHGPCRRGGQRLQAMKGGAREWADGHGDARTASAGASADQAAAVSRESARERSAGGRPEAPPCSRHHSHGTALTGAGASPASRCSPWAFTHTMPVLVQTCSQSAPPCTRTTAWASTGKHALNANNHMASHAVQRLCLAGLNMPRMVAEGPHARGRRAKSTLVRRLASARFS